MLCTLPGKMASKSERVYDELISFLGDPMFQIPVRTFMDENCLIFDPSIEAGADAKVIHGKYKKLIDALLEGFCQDLHITVDEAIQGVTKLQDIPDVREVFNALFEQVLAATDFAVFCQVMMKRNIMIQEQVLVMIIAATGGLPESLLGGEVPGKPSAGGKGKASAPPPQQSMNLDKQEDEILKQVMQSSKKDQDKLAKQQKSSDAELTKTLELSKHEATVLQQERHKVEENMKNLTLETPSAAVPSRQKQEVPKVQQPVQLPPSLAAASSGAKPMSGAEAASKWLADAQAATGQSSTHNALAASLSKLSPEELQKRQKFLTEQRDRLLAKKKEEREKQLGAEVTKRPSRPQSARAARAAMDGAGGKGAAGDEDEKKLAMRRAIAAKLKQEVIGKQ